MPNQLPIELESSAVTLLEMTNDWRFSFHGGHNSESPRHASSDVDALVMAAEETELAAFGLVAHEPRREERFVYAEESAEGLTPDDLAADYARFLERSAEAIAGYRGPVHLLRGIELENLPPLEEWGGAPPRPSSWREDGLDFYLRFLRLQF